MYSASTGLGHTTKSKSTILSKLNNLPVFSGESTSHTEKRNTKLASSRTSMENMLEAYHDAELEETTNQRQHQVLSPKKAQEPALHVVDKLVLDLLASRKHVEEERKKGAEKEADIARLEEKVACLMDEARTERQKRQAADVRVQELEQQLSALSPADSEEVTELRRLLAFHKTNGEQVSRRFRDMQAINQELTASLQDKQVALEEQASLLKGLGVPSNDP